ncbi:MAG: hypothetical protein Kow00121_65120 [Elainellaceae cyanobacterium]
MKLLTSMVAIQKIKPTASRWNFPEEELNQAARLIIETAGTINPLVLRRENGAESYEVLDGNFEYYAAAKANEIEPHRCGAIAAFVVEPEDEPLIRAQIQLFRGSLRQGAVSLNGLHLTSEENGLSIEARLRTLESRQAQLESRQTAFETQELQAIQQQLAELSDQFYRRTNLLNLFNNAEHTELLHRLKSVGIVGKTAEKIVEMIEYERHYKAFASLREVVTRVKGLTYEKIVDLIEA